MRDDQARAALADAIQLHKERVKLAEEHLNSLQSQVELAEKRLLIVRAAMDNFMRYVQPSAA